MLSGGRMGRLKKLRITVTALALSVSAAFAAASTYTVLWQGTLRVVHAGDTSGKVSLQQFAGKEHLYAVGPVAGLDGEVTAIGGKFYIARVRHGEIKTDDNLSTSASFLVWSEIAAWKPSVPLGVQVGNHTQLEQLLEALALQAGMDITKPFPFKLDGVFDSIDYHILVPQSHAQAHGGHRDGAKKMSAKKTEATMIGFFSKNHEGVFTHRGSFAHLHVVERNGNSGHVDDLVAHANVSVSFPQ